MKSSSQHWNQIFSSTEDAKLGWYEENASRTMELVNQIPEWERATVFLPGVGTSILVEELLSMGTKLILNDISIEALNQVKNRLNDEGRDIVWFCHDIAQPIQGRIPSCDIWIDRAVLHFLTDEDDIEGYFDNVRSVLRVGAHAIFAEFSKTGASECAGLTLHRYSVEELSERLGSSFQLVSHFNHTYTNPFGGKRPYVYALYRKEKSSIAERFRGL